MTKAASYLLWLQQLLDDPRLPADARGVDDLGLDRRAAAPRHAAPASTQTTYGTFTGSYLGANATDNDAFRKLWSGSPAASSSSATATRTREGNVHLMITAPKADDAMMRLAAPAGGSPRSRAAALAPRARRGRGRSRAAGVASTRPRTRSPAASTGGSRPTPGAIHVWVPPGYDRATAGTVVYVHGYHTDSDGAWKDHDLARQFKASGQNAIFIVPDAPRATTSR